MYIDLCGKKKKRKRKKLAGPRPLVRMGSVADWPMVADRCRSIGSAISCQLAYHARGINLIDAFLT
jgi:hypothetical protein